MVEMKKFLLSSDLIAVMMPQGNTDSCVCVILV